MTLRRTVFYVAGGLYIACLLASLAVISGIVVNIFQPRTVDVVLPAMAFIGCLSLRLIFALWLKKLGGVPQEVRSE